VGTRGRGAEPAEVPLAPRRGRRGRWVAHGQTTAAFLLILLTWQLVGLKVPRYILPTPLATLVELYVRAPLLAQHALTTLREIGLGFLLAVLVSVPCGMAVAFSRSVERVVMPVLVFTQLVPKIALAPLFIIWFGFGLFPKVFMTFLLSFFPIVIDSIAGFRSLDREVEHLIRSMGLGAWPAFVKVRLPHALPQIFTGLKVAITLASSPAARGQKRPGTLREVAQDPPLDRPPVPLILDTEKDHTDPDDSEDEEERQGVPEGQSPPSAPKGPRRETCQGIAMRSTSVTR
jgi:NitT/TauT family transport system permease protein